MKLLFITLRNKCACMFLPNIFFKPFKKSCLRRLKIILLHFSQFASFCLAISILKKQLCALSDLL